MSRYRLRRRSDCGRIASSLASAIMLLATSCGGATADASPPALGPIVATLHQRGMARDIAWSPDGLRIAALSIMEPGYLVLWDVAKDRLIRSVPIVNFESYLTTICFSPDNRSLVYGSPGRGEADRRAFTILDGHTGMEVGTRKRPFADFFASSGFAAAVSPLRANYVAMVFGLTGDTLALYDPTTWERIMTLDAPTGEHFALAVRVSADGRRLAVSTYELPWGLSPPRPAPFRVFDTASGRIERTVPTDMPGAAGYWDFLGFAFSPDGQQLMYVQGKRPSHLELVTVDLANGAILHTPFKDDPGARVVWDPQGRIVAGISPSHLRILAANTFTLEEDIELADRTGDGVVAFSPDGSAIAYSNGNDVVIRRIAYGK